MNTLLQTTPTAEYNTTANVTALHKYSSDNLINAIESRLALLEGGRKAITTKSFRSARFALLKELRKSIQTHKTLTVLSYDTAESWTQDVQVLNRLNVRILFVNQFSNQTLEEVIISKGVDVVYLSSIHAHSLTVEDHRSVIQRSHAHNALVVFDNTAGGLGSVYQPLVHGADYVLSQTSSSLFTKHQIGAYVVEGYANKAQNVSLLSVEDTSVLDKLQSRRKLSVKQSFLVLADQRLPEIELTKEIVKEKIHSKNTFIIAKWLNQSQLVMDVNYPGLKTSDSFLNAESNLRGGYGKVVSFKIWEEDFSFNLLRTYFISGKPNGLTITTDNQLREFKVRIETDQLNDVLSYFQRVFTMLHKELEYRSLLKKQLKIQQAVDEILKSH